MTHFQIENMEHCDFVPLRNMLIRTYLQDLKEVTNNVLYENFRCRKLAGVAGTTMDKIPNKVINNFGTIQQNLLQPFLMVLFGLTDRSWGPRGQGPLVRVPLRHNITAKRSSTKSLVRLG